MKIRQERPWGSLFRRPQHKFFHLSSNAPMTVIRGPVQAEMAVVAAETIFWGCAEQNIRTTLPFDGVREGFAAF